MDGWLNRSHFNPELLCLCRISSEIHFKLFYSVVLLFFWQKIKLADNMIVGSDFEVFTVLTNNCMEAKTCTFLFFARAVGYNGKQGESCGFASEKLEVPSGEG